jgi:protein required for attachment to host cells
VLAPGFGETNVKGHDMKIPKGATVAVADGEILNLFRNTGEESAPKLTAMPDGIVSTGNKGSGGRHQSSSANPSESQQNEDGFAAGTAALLNSRVLDGGIADLIIVAAPRTLGELRKHYHKSLSAILLGEISKDLTGHSIADVEKTIMAA